MNIYSTTIQKKYAAYLGFNPVKLDIYDVFHKIWYQILVYDAFHANTTICMRELMPFN